MECDSKSCALALNLIPVTSDKIRSQQPAASRLWHRPEQLWIHPRQGAKHRTQWYMSCRDNDPIAIALGCAYFTSSKCWDLHPHVLFQKASSAVRKHLPQAIQNLQPLPFRAISIYGIIILIRRCVRNRKCAAVVWFPALPGMAAWKSG